jgi:hypothetical protein
MADVAVRAGPIGAAIARILWNLSIGAAIAADVVEGMRPGRVGEQVEAPLKRFSKLVCIDEKNELPELSSHVVPVTLIKFHQFRGGGKWGRRRATSREIDETAQ